MIYCFDKFHEENYPYICLSMTLVLSQLFFYAPFVLHDFFRLVTELLIHMPSSHIGGGDAGKCRPPFLTRSRDRVMNSELPPGRIAFVRSH